MTAMTTWLKDPVECANERSRMLYSREPLITSANIIAGIVDSAAVKRAGREQS